MKFAGTDWIPDAYEYIGESVSDIGTSAPMVKDAVELKIKDHRHKLPCEIETIYFVEYNGRKLNNGGDYTGYSLPKLPRTTKIYSLSSTGTQSADLVYLNGDPATYESELLSPVDSEYYLLNPDYIQTSFEEGCIKVHFAGFPVDSSGCPYIVDDYNYETAVTWYVISQVLLSGYEHKKIDWTMAEQKYEEHKAKARNNMKMPDMGEMERFRQMWVRMIPPKTLPQDFFAGAETTEFIAGL